MVQDIRGGELKKRKDGGTSKGSELQSGLHVEEKNSPYSESLAIEKD